MKKIAVIPNPLKDIGFVETKNVINFLNKFECIIYLEDDYYRELKDFVEKGNGKFIFTPRNEIFKNIDFLISLGGDGTIIEIAVDAAKYEIPILGINVGTLGFLTQAEKGDYSLIENVINGNYGITKCMMLDVSVFDKSGNIKAHSLALNDVIMSGDLYKMITTSTSVNGTIMGEYSSDGIIVSSAIGSTAYSLSAGGAVMHPEVDGMIVTPICPHTLKARSTVIPGESVVRIAQIPPFRTEAIIRADGKFLCKIESGEEYIELKRSKYYTLLIKQGQTNFFDVLRNKLSD